MQFDPGMEYRPDWVEANGKLLFLITNTNTNTNENTKHKYKHEYLLDCTHVGIKANYNCIFYHL